MGKYNHIPMLTGTENYHAWRTNMKYALGAEDLWCHINTGTDPLDPLNFVSIKPLPAVVTQPTDIETTAIRNWLVDDIKMKGFIHHFLSTPIRQMIPDDQELIGCHYGRKNLGTQFIIRKQLAALHMKDAPDASRYMGEHLSLRCRLLEMGTNFSKEESVFQLLTRLPQHPEWRMFKSQIEQCLHNEYSGTVITSTLNNGSSISATFQHNPMTFESCSTRICGEASRQMNEKH
ncbi:hypothetical protein PAXRUDRAFT_162253 [Paxillus rubicundulus Ve08.2h10]|uniref:DUF4219 domain-containing protein n=1 Tax=Paxillus rubicundulus Ve08.2h10 TaxID=930991 RepID=A0A0D0CUG0_9AGAM|nr:hypothetical protein PAXRUDRAFT_162253 [Paxillus rubicundulus Ve08.2h10]